MIHSLKSLDYPARFQFGQAAPCRGTTSCTDTCMQMLGEYWKEKTYSLNEVRKLAQAKTHFDENPCTGINMVEALNGLAAMGINYRGATNITASYVATKVALGPVIVGVSGASYPADAQNHCGKINKAEHGGRTQCSFKGAHAILVIGFQKHIKNGKTIHWDFIARDPNHNSSGRPEKPTFDRITLAQMSKAINDLPKHSAFNTTFCLYPTKRKVL